MITPIKDLVRKKLESTIREDVQEIMNKAVEATLDIVSDSLVVRFVAASDNTFKVEFTWKGN